MKIGDELEFNTSGIKATLLNIGTTFERKDEILIFNRFLQQTYWINSCWLKVSDDQIFNDQFEAKIK